MAGLGLSTVVDFERSRRAVSADAVAAIRSALEGADVEFTNGERPGVRLLPPYSIITSGKTAYYLTKEDAVEAAREWLKAAKRDGEEVVYNHRKNYWWTAIDGRRTDRTLVLNRPVGNAINDANRELDIGEEEE
jgi:hypothetical protein